MVNFNKSKATLLAKFVRALHRYRRGQPAGVESWIKARFFFFFFWRISLHNVRSSFILFFIPAPDPIYDIDHHSIVNIHVYLIRA